MKKTLIMLAFLPMTFGGCTLMPEEKNADMYLPVSDQDCRTKILPSHCPAPGCAAHKKQKEGKDLSRREHRKAEEEKLWKSHKRRIEKVLRQARRKTKELSLSPKGSRTKAPPATLGGK